MIRAACLKAALAALLLAAAPAIAETLRVATYSPDLSRKGPALLLRDIGRDDAQIAAVVEVIAAARPDILLLTAFDWDYEGRALDAFAELLAARGVDYPYRFAAMPNRGVASGLDLDGDGRLGGYDDAQGFGQFTGQAAMALLSNRPLGEVRDYTDALWADQPGSLMPADTAPEVRATQRLGSSGHWDVAVDLGGEAGGQALHLLALSATPPLDARNRRRNADEVLFWTRHLPAPPFVVLGKLNVDPVDGDGDRQALRALMGHVQDPAPRSDGGAAAGDARHRGDPALDTASWPGRDDLGNLRVDYVLPSQDLAVLDAGVVWPKAGPLAEVVAAASPHRLVWVDLEID